jgi:serine/threonine protein kinase
MHDNNIVHRDLKPENLLLTSEKNDFDIKVVDFGFATEVNGNNLVDQYGTPGYIAPEILLGTPYGKSVDMWSFGVILYILLGGYPPFYDQDRVQLFKKISAARFEFHPGYWSEVSPEAKDLICKLLVVDVNLRLTVDLALRHTWFQSQQVLLEKRVLSQSLSELRKFQARRKLRAGIRTVLAIARMQSMANNSAALRDQLVGLMLRGNTEHNHSTITTSDDASSV